MQNINHVLRRPNSVHVYRLKFIETLPAGRPLDDESKGRQKPLIPTTPSWRAGQRCTYPLFCPQWFDWDFMRKYSTKITLHWMAWRLEWARILNGAQLYLKLIDCLQLYQVAVTKPPSWQVLMSCHVLIEPILYSGRYRPLLKTISWQDQVHS